MSNVLTKPVLNTATPEQIFYTVVDGNDYFVALSTLLALVTKASIGLSNVNNTSDEDKPVSAATRQALDSYNEEISLGFQAIPSIITDALASYVTTAQLQAAINGINQILDGKTTPQQVNTIVQGTIDPIVQSIQQHSAQISDLQNLVDNLSQTGQGDVTTAQLNQVIGRVAALEQGLTNLSDSFSSHTHSANSISGLQAYVENIVNSMSTSNVVTGLTDW